MCAFSLACKNNHPDCAVYLIEEAELADEKGDNGLMWVVKYGYNDIVQIIAPKLMNKTNNKKKSAFIIAC